jgi:hypothetical protein
MNTPAIRPVENPTRCAACILQAWRQTDQDRLDVILRRAGSTGAGCGTLEIEQAELLTGIVAEMRQMLASGEVEGSEACLGLLRHLAWARPSNHYVQ